MTTQLLVTMKDAGFFTKMFSNPLLWFIEVFLKAKVNVWIDSKEGEPITLTPRKTPYEIPLTPGEHTVYFVDPKLKIRSGLWRFIWKISIGYIFFVVGLASGGNALEMGADATEGVGRAKVRDDVLECTLGEGDELAVRIKPKMTKVKIKIEN